MEDEIFHLLEIVQPLAYNRNVFDPQLVTYPKIFKFIREEVDWRMCHMVRDLQTRLTALNEDRVLASITEP